MDLSVIILKWTWAHCAQLPYCSVSILALCMPRPDHIGSACWGLNCQSPTNRLGLNHLVENFCRWTASSDNSMFIGSNRLSHCLHLSFQSNRWKYCGLLCASACDRKAFSWRGLAVKGLSKIAWETCYNFNRTAKIQIFMILHLLSSVVFGDQNVAMPPCWI
jgi:hypothetical protein